MKTHGYDYAFALSQTEVNSILDENLKNRTIAVKYDIKDADSGTTVTVDITLSPWKVVAGGSNTLLNLELPVKAGYMSIEGGALPSNSYDLTNVSVVVQVELGWLGTGDQQQANGSGSTGKLVFSPATGAKNNPGYVAPVTVIDPDKQLDSIGVGILKETIVQGLVDNKKNLQYIFANVDPTPAKVTTWLRPYKWQYYYVGSKTGPSALTFLCQLSNKAFPPQPTFDSQNLDATNNSLLLISQESFFDNVVLPGVRKTFSSGSFTSRVNAEEAVTISNSGDFNVGKVTTKSFKLVTSNSGNGLAISASGGGPLKFFFGLGKLPNASYSWGVASVNPLHYAAGVVTFTKDPKPTKTHDQTIHWYDWILLVGLGITNIAGLVSFIVDAVNGFYDGSEAMGIGKINDDFQASVDGTVVNLSNLVSWNKPGESFAPTIAGLELAFYVRGNLVN